MNRALAIAAVLLLIGAGYVLFRGVTREAPPAETHSGLTIVELRTESIQEKTSTYVVKAKYPQFGIPSIDEQIASKVDTIVTQFKRDATEAPPVPDSVVSQYELTVTFEDVYVDETVVSASLIAYTYMGGAHGISVITGLNFERATGRELTTSDAFDMIGLSLADVATRAANDLRARLGEDVIAPEGADATLENYSTFVVDAERVTFIFQVYQVAPYAAGPQNVSFVRVR